MGKKKIKTIEANAQEEASREEQRTSELYRKRKRMRKYFPVGRAYVYATYNNTIISLTDPQGNVIAQSSAGRLGFKGAKKSTPYAAGRVVQAAVEKSQLFGLAKVDVFLKGIGAGREASIRALAAQGLEVLSIRDLTPIPHNGCRPPKARRV